MELIQIKYDGRCRWLDAQMRKMIPQMFKSVINFKAKTIYVMESWVSTGKTGANLKWLRNIGIPIIKDINHLPKGNNYAILNTGYDTILEEEQILIEKGIEIIDKACPYCRKLRTIFEEHNPNYQYVLLCEPDHIILKNYRTLFPKDMILVQLNNYQEKIQNEQSGKPIRFVPYVTFLPTQIDRIFEFINRSFPDRTNEIYKTSCIWASSPTSPITEINNLDLSRLTDVKDALVIIAPNSTNTSSESLITTITNKGLKIVPISSLNDFISYKNSHINEKVLFIRSPIPSIDEKHILLYIKNGIFLSSILIFTNFIKLWLYKFFFSILLIIKVLKYSLINTNYVKEINYNDDNQ